MSTLRVLGAVEIAQDDDSTPGVPATGRTATQPPLRVRRLLAALATRAGEVVTPDWLADAVWGDAQPSNPTAALQTLASRLRALIAHDPDLALRTQPPGYVLDVADGRFDARLFERWAADGAQLLDDDAASAVATLERALRLWTGPAYGEFAAEEFALTEVARLEELRATAQEDRVDAALALGQHHHVLAEIEALVASAPLRERRRGQLMVARHRAGRTAEALEAYRELRDLLADELGIEPSAALRVLHNRILQEDPALQLPSARHRPQGPVSVVTGRAADGPAAHGLVGRTDELSELAALVVSTPVVTLVGPGGVGKTSLALAAADTVGPSFADGARVVRLAPVQEPTAVPLAVASALEVPGRAGVDTVARLVEWLAPQRTLLVLDNCEHLLAPVAMLVAAVREGAPGVHVLTTSQAAVALPGEQLVDVPPLRTDADGEEPSPAVRLFEERAMAHRRDFRVGPDDADQVAEICRRLDGLPLAIELAAARMRSMSPADLVARLSGRFRLLHGGSRTALERHRALRSLVDWSYGLLGAEEQQVFDVLSAFAGRFTLTQAEALVAAVADDVEAADAATHVLTLVDRSMVVSRPGTPTAYSMLETLRSYGQERLRERGVATRVHDVHAAQTADLVAPTRARIYSERQIEDVALVNDALDEMRAGFAWSVDRDPLTAARIVSGAATLVEMRMTAEPGHWARTLLAHLDRSGTSLPSEDLAWVHAVAASAARFTGELTVAEEEATRAAGLAGEASTQGYARYVLSEARLFHGDIEASADDARVGQELAHRAGLPVWEVVFGMSLALVSAYTGDAGRGRRIAEETSVIAATVPGSPVRAWCTYTRGEVLLDDDPAAAAPLLEEALRQAEANGDRFLYGVALLSAASAHSRCGDPRVAVAMFRRAVEHWRLTGTWTQQWTTLRNVVVLLTRLGRHETAATLAAGIAANAPAAHAVAAEAERMRRTHEDLVARLGQERYDEAARAGALLDPAALVDHALRELT